MPASWFFNPFRRGDQRNDPISHALFSQDEVTDLAGSVVREAIQNSLDAHPDDSTNPVEVRFTLRRRTAPSAESFAPFLAGLREHLEAEGTGLDSVPPRGGSVPLLTIEDFETSGLDGDPEQWDPLEGERNGFFLFFHATGTSGKTGESRGRWGVGKFVFPMASRANTWFGMTVSAGRPSPLLMGRCVLKTHRANGITCHPDGRWGVESEAFVRPVISPDPLVVAFSRLAGLTRGSRQGLSVTIPWVREELTAEAIKNAVVREYFVPLLRRELVVTIDNDGDALRLDETSVRSLAESGDDRALGAVLSLAIEAVAFRQDQFVVTLPSDSDGAPSWSPDLLTEAQRQSIATKLDGGGTVGVRVPLRVRPKNAASQPTYFDIFVKSAEQLGRQYPLVVREGITVPKARTTGIGDCVALALVDHKPLVGLIGDSENPAHTELLHKLIKDKYTYAKSTLDLLREAPAGLVRALREGETEDDPFLLSDLFPAIDEPGSGRSERPTPRRGPVTPPPPPPPPPPRPRRFRIDAVTGGFSIAGTLTDPDIPPELELACAYEVRRGSALRQYDILDFNLADGSMYIDTSEATIVSISENRVKVRPESSSFRVTVTGFDANRDVYVRAVME